MLFRSVDRRKLSPDAAKLAIETEDRAALMDSLILCKFLRGVFEDFYVEGAEMLNLVTGWDTTADELRTTAQRIVAAKKLFNIRAGWNRAEDQLPQRFLEAPLKDDAAASLSREELQRAIAAYYTARGWDEEGRLTPAGLRALGLDTW